MWMSDAARSVTVNAALLIVGIIVGLTDEKTEKSYKSEALREQQQSLLDNEREDSSELPHLRDDSSLTAGRKR